MTPGRALLLASTLLLAAPARAASEFREALRRAEARAAGDPERLEFASRAIRAWSPADGRLMLSHAHLRRAEALLLRGEDAAAAEDLSRVLENDPLNRQALLLRGRAWLASGRALRAEADFAAYVGAKPEDPEGWIGLASARLPDNGAGRPAEARKAASRARRLASSDWRPDWLEGRAWLRERRHEEALEALDRAVRLAKGARAEPLEERAEALTRQGRHAQAAEDWGQVIRLHERGLVEAERTRAGAASRNRGRERLAAAYVARGRLREFLGDAGARHDFAEACELGRRDACAKGAAPESAPRRRSRPRGAGERLYGS